MVWATQPRGSLSPCHGLKQKGWGSLDEHHVPTHAKWSPGYPGQTGFMAKPAGLVELYSHPGLAAAVSLAQATAETQSIAAISLESDVDEDVYRGSRRIDIRCQRHHRGSANARGAAGLPPREIPRGALAPHYNIPSVDLHPSRGVWLLALSALVTAALIGRHVLLAWLRWPDTIAMLAGIFIAAFMTSQWALSLLYRPRELTRSEQSRVDKLNVSVIVPCYNEDPAVLDRCIYALVTQTRPPQQVNVVDDGSTEDYTSLRGHWEGTWPSGTEVVWSRQQNQGKKRAQATGFNLSPEADIFITIDSDTALEKRAIEEGIKPFADRGVSSVAGIEIAFNAHVNWLTQAMNSRGVFYQLILCQVQGILGDMYVNRGAFALYRAPLIRRILPAYVGETFFGYPVKLGDDSALTLFARGSGRTVQQSTAFGLSMFPEKLSHHVRQRVRWGRGAAIRNLWRLRYLPIFSYIWWFTFIRIHVSILPLAVPVLTLLFTKGSALPMEQELLVSVGWTLMTGLRTLSIHRSDETLWQRIMTVLVRPSANIWAMLIIIPIRFYGTMTFYKQGWTTRNQGAEEMAPLEETVEAGLVPTRELVTA